VVLTGLFLYLHFTFVLTPLQQFDLPIYTKTTVVASIRQSDKYQLLLMADKKGHTLYARDVDVAAGSTAQVMPSPSACIVRFRRQSGMVYLYRSVPTVYQNSSLVAISGSRSTAEQRLSACFSCRSSSVCLRCWRSFRSPFVRTFAVAKK